MLLVTHPLKPRGRRLNAADVAALSNWLAVSSRRRLLIDTAYTFDTRFDPATSRLLATDQAILLHSVTKGWLHPRLFGITLVPEEDANVLTPLFRAHAPSQDNLARARQMLGPHANMPALVAAELASAWRRMRERLPSAMSVMRYDDTPGYFICVSGSWRELLDTHRVLGLPATVFGSARKDITILSSLVFV